MQALRDIRNGRLLYALIGVYDIDQIVLAKTIDRSRWSENAHTRRFPRSDDIVVQARKKGSGRLHKCIPIGEYRDRAYRVKKRLIDLPAVPEWSDFDDCHVEVPLRFGASELICSLEHERAK